MESIVDTVMVGLAIILVVLVLVSHAQRDKYIADCLERAHRECVERTGE
jgi:heme exporter protein D